MNYISNDYIQSGLVLHLDGINKGSDNSWVDLINNREFTEHGTLTKDSSSYIFDGTKNINYLTYNIDDTFPEFTQDNCTVEICYKLNEINDNKYFIFGSVPSWSFKPMFYVASNDNITWNQHGHIYTGFSNNGESILYNTETPITLSINGDRNIVNGSSLGYMTETVDYWDTNNDNIYHIGLATSGGAYDYPFNGHIYSIRFYNRKLTQAEQLHNQQVDNIRFNLGLTIGE